MLDVIIPHDAARFQCADSRYDVDLIRAAHFLKALCVLDHIRCAVVAVVEVVVTIQISDDGPFRLRLVLLAARNSKNYN